MSLPSLSDTHEARDAVGQYALLHAEMIAVLFLSPKTDFVPSSASSGLRYRDGPSSIHH